jgi:hypothetical protein
VDAAGGGATPPQWDAAGGGATPLWPTDGGAIPPGERERESGGVRGVKVECFEIKTGQKVWMVGPTRWVVGR